MISSPWLIMPRIGSHVLPCAGLADLEHLLRTLDRASGLILLLKEGSPCHPEIAPRAPLSATR
jgi:hypothetical protein